MDILISSWNDISQHLNGYILDHIYFMHDNTLVGVNSKGQEMPLASRRGMNQMWWQSEPGMACEAIDLILDEARIQVKESGDYSEANKKKIVQNVMERVIKLYGKGYKESR